MTKAAKEQERRDRIARELQGVEKTGRQGNPKGSKWRSTPDSKRKRKRLIITLDPTTEERLRRASTETLNKPMSQIIEEAVIVYLDEHDP